MSTWQNFLDDVFGHEDKPGKVMICFVNRNMAGMDDIKYKIKFDGLEKSGTTSMEKYCIEITPKSFSPIQTFVWSRQAMAYKRLEDVVPEKGKKKLVQKAMKTFKVPAKTEKLPNTPPVKRPEKPAAAPAPAPSPLTDQGITPVQKKNESNQPQAQASRSIPREITTLQLRKIFPLNGGAPTDSHLQAVANELNSDLAKYKLDTPARRAHFFGQIKRESPQLSGAAESLNYTPAGLIATFGYYKKAKHKHEAQTDGRLDEKLTNGKRKNLRAANQEVIANKVYMPDDGNTELGNKQPGDGWLYRGRGVHQTTGRFNYQEFTNTYPKYWNGKVDFLTNPDMVAQMPYTLRSAVAFWLDNKCWIAADKGVNDAAIDSVTKIINSGEVKKHLAGKYEDSNSNPVVLRRQYVYLAYGAFT